MSARRPFQPSMASTPLESLQQELLTLQDEVAIIDQQLSNPDPKDPTTGESFSLDARRDWRYRAITAKNAKLSRLRSLKHHIKKREFSSERPSPD